MRGPIAVVIVWAAFAGAALGEAPDTYDYEVRPGDNCLRIAIRELGDRKGYRQIHAHNPNMGPTPHRLEPGQILTLPRLEKSADANLSQKNGEVDVRSGASREWNAADLGMELYRAWRVRTREEALALLTFRDQSKLAMRQDSVVIIYGPQARLSRRRPARAELRSGALRSRLAELSGAGSLVVETPSSEATLGSGSALVSVDSKGATRVANHGGQAARVKGRGKRGKGRGDDSAKATQVAVGMGSRVEPGSAPTPPQELPPSPAWRDYSAFALAAEKRGGSIFGRWESVAEAVAYRVEISTDSEGLEGVGVATVAKDVLSFEMHGLPPGSYYASVASIDAESFEGIPSPRQAIEVHGVVIVRDTEVLRPASPGPQLKPAATASSALAMQLGDILRLPSGLICEATAAEHGDQRGAGHRNSLTITDVRATAIRCDHENGTSPVSLPIQVAAPESSLEAPAGPVPKGRFLPMTVTLTGVRSIGSFEVRSNAVDVRVVRLRQNRDDPNRAELSFQVLVREESVGDVVLTVVGVGEDGVFPVATFPLEIESPAPLKPPTPWTVGAFLGMLAVEKADVGFDNGAVLGARVAFDIGTRLSLSIDLAGSAVGIDALEEDGDEEIGAVFLGRLAASARVLGPPRASLWLQAGGSFAALHSDVLGGDTTAGVFYGGTLRIQPSRHIGIRADVRHIVAGDLQHAVDVLLGVEYRL